MRELCDLGQVLQPLCTFRSQSTTGYDWTPIEQDLWED